MSRYEMKSCCNAAKFLIVEDVRPHREKRRQAIDSALFIACWNHATSQ